MDKFVSQIRGIVQNEISFAKKAEMKSRIFKHYKIQQSFASVKFGFFRRLFLKQKLQFLHMLLHNSARMFVLRRVGAMALFVFVTLPLFSFLWVAPNVSMADFHVQISQVSGMVEVQRGEEFYILNNENKILEGDRVVLAQDSFVEFYMPSIGYVRAKGGTDVEFTKIGDYNLDHDVDLSLKAGSLWLNTHDINNSNLNLNISVADFNMPIQKNTLANVDYVVDVRVAVLKNKLNVNTEDALVDFVMAGQILQADKSDRGFENFDSNGWIMQNLASDKMLSNNNMLASVDENHVANLLDLAQNSNISQVERIALEFSELNEMREGLSNKIARQENWNGNVKNDLTRAAEQVYELALDVNEIKPKDFEGFNELSKLKKVVEAEIEKQEDLIEYVALKEESLISAKANLGKARVASDVNEKQLVQMQQAQEILLDLQSYEAQAVDEQAIDDIKSVLDSALIEEQGEFEAQDIEESRELMDLAQQNINLLDEIAKDQDDIEVLEEIESVKESLSESVDNLAQSYKFELPSLNEVATKTTVDGDGGQTEIIKENIDVQDLLSE